MEVVYINGVPYIPAPQQAPAAMGYPVAFRQPQDDGIADILPELLTMPALQAGETAETLVSADLAGITVPADYPAGNATTVQVNEVKSIVQKVLDNAKKDVASNAAVFAAMRKRALLGLLGRRGGGSSDGLLLAFALGGF